MDGFFGFLAAIVAFFGSLLGRKPEDPMMEAEKHDAEIAEEQARIVADHTRPSTVDSLRDGEF